MPIIKYCSHIDIAGAYCSIVKCEDCGKIRASKNSGLRRASGNATLCRLCSRRRNFPNGFKHLPKPRHTLQSYKNFGLDKNLNFIGTVIPANARKKALWQCFDCGYRFKLSMTQIKKRCDCAHHKKIATA